MRQTHYEWPIERDRDDRPLSLDRLDAHSIQPEFPRCSVQLAGLLDIKIQRRRIGRRRRHVQLKTAVTQIDFPSYLAFVDREFGMAIDLRLCDGDLSPQSKQRIEIVAGEACQRH